MSKVEANAAANEWIKGRAALHSPDAVAGGKVDETTDIGDSRVNSSIGSQWKREVSDLDEYIKGLAAGKTDDELKKMLMNVRIVK